MKKIISVVIGILIVGGISAFFIARGTSENRAIKKVLGKYDKDCISVIDTLNVEKKFLNKKGRVTNKIVQEKIIWYTKDDRSELINLEKDKYGFWSPASKDVSNNCLIYRVVGWTEKDDFEFLDFIYNDIHYYSGNNATKPIRINFDKLPKGYSINVIQHKEKYVIRLENYILPDDSKCIDNVDDFVEIN